MRIVITGGSGRCGTALADLPGEKLFVDRAEKHLELGANEFRQVDLGDRDQVHSLLQKGDVLVHLAAAVAVDSPWSDVMRENVQNTRQLFSLAAEAGVERIIFASSNHAVGMYELDNAPGIYELGHGIMIDQTVPVRPDSPYGISKVFAEAMGRQLAENGGPRFYAIRIGAIRGSDEDHPYAYAEAGVRRGEWERGSEPYLTQEKRLKAIWQSRRDFRQMVERLLHADGERFDVFYGISANARSWMDIQHARDVLGYAPQDDAETWTAPPSK